MDKDNTFSSLDNVMTSNQNPLLDSTSYSPLLPWNSIRTDPLQMGSFDFFNSLLTNKYLSFTSPSINVQESFEIMPPPPPPRLHPLNNLRSYDDSTNMWSFGETSEFRGYPCPNEPIMSTFNEEDFSMSLATDVSDECSEISLTRIASEQASCSSKDISYVSQVIFGSKYLHHAQEILSHFAAFSLNGLEINPQCCYSSQGPDNSCFENLTREAGLQRSLESKKTHLLDLLQMVDDRYSQCVEEIYAVVSAFHAATELDPQLHSKFALKTISFLFRNLRDRISEKILMMGSERGKEKSQGNDVFQQMEHKNNQIWRPQRCLPEKSVLVLRTWMFENFLHPYPKDSEKQLLAMRSGLTRSQVTNWFINSRVRLWKPMIEEMYAEMNQAKLNNSYFQGNGASLRMPKSFMMTQERHN